MWEDVLNGDCNEYNTPCRENSKENMLGAGRPPKVLYSSFPTWHHTSLCLTSSTSSNMTMTNDDPMAGMASWYWLSCWVSTTRPDTCVLTPPLDPAPATTLLNSSLLVNWTLQQDLVIQYCGCHLVNNAILSDDTIYCDILIQNVVLIFRYFYSYLYPLLSIDTIILAHKQYIDNILCICHEIK